MRVFEGTYTKFSFPESIIAVKKTLKTDREGGQA